MSDETTDQNKRRLRLAFIIAVLLGALILLVAVELASVPDKKPPAEPPAPSGALPASGSGVSGVAANTTTPSPEPGPTAVRAFGSTPSAPPAAAPTERSPLADDLNAPDGNARLDVTIVANLFAYYLEQFRELPVGNNAEITAALAGDNARGYAVVPPDHSAINRGGELTDRWGSAYLFHQLAGDLMEVRSFGPDRRRFTADDVVWPVAETAHPPALAGAMP